MRQQLMHGLALAGVAAALGISTAAPADAQSAIAPDTRFRIVFPIGSATPSRMHAQANSAAAVRMERTLLALVAQPAVRFVLVGRREAMCNSIGACAHDDMLADQVGAVRALIRAVGPERVAQLPFNRFQPTFVDEIDPVSDLAPAPAGFGAVDMRLMLAGTRSATTCPAGVMLLDPALPSVIGATPAQPSLPLAQGAVQASERSRLTLKPAADKSLKLYTFWSSPSGQFAKAEGSLQAGKEIGLAQLPRSLHVLTIGVADRRFDGFLNGLTAQMQSFKSIPAIVEGSLEVPAARGFGDNVGRLPPGGLVAARPGTPEPRHCRIAFEQLP